MVPDEKMSDRQTYDSSCWGERERSSSGDNESFVVWQTNISIHTAMLLAWLEREIEYDYDVLIGFCAVEMSIILTLSKWQGRVVNNLVASIADQKQGRACLAKLQM